ncbi:MAG: methyltransferase domain-containing protein [Rhodocyclaceae bacterium]|nr:methyltransferase domain-containing protein [Rhodocyclaceae bacterium]
MALPRWLYRYFGLVTERDAAARLLDSKGAERLLLHVGCGPQTIRDLPPGFSQGFREIRVDLDASARPDLIASFTDLSVIPDASVDAIFTSHTLEHLYWFEVSQALAECRRVLRPQGMLVITCPDLQAVAKLIAEDRIDDVAYHSPAGPITPFDIVYGYRPFVQLAPQTMSHKCGFTLRTLTNAVCEAGFRAYIGHRRPHHFDLWLLARPEPTPEADLQALAARFLLAPV